MLGQALADGEIRRHGIVVQRRHIGRRRWRRRPKKVLEDPLAPNHRRGARGVGRNGQNASLAQQAAALPVGAERDAAKAIAVDMGDAVMLGEALVEEGVVRLEQIEHAPVLAKHALDEKLRFLPEGLAQIVVEVREQAQVRRDRFQIAQMQPLRGEIGREVARAIVRQQSPHLLFKHLRLAKLVARGQVQKLVVRNAAPQEERQP